MISKKMRDALSDEDQGKRYAALDSIKKIDPRDLDLVVQSAWGFDETYLRRVVQVITQVRDERSALAISSILFASTQESQEAIRTACLDALSQNPTEAATNTLIQVAKNQKFYTTQCEAIKRLGSRGKEDRILAVLHDIVMEKNYFPSTEEAKTQAKAQPYALVLSAFEALSSTSLRNEKSVLVILNKISNPSCENPYREQGAKHLAKMGFDSLVDPVLDKVEENVADLKVVFPLLGAIKNLKKDDKQKQRLRRLIEQILPQVSQDQALNENLVSLMEDIMDADLVEVISIVTSNWILGKSAGRSVVRILDACPKNSPKTIIALLRYAETPQWNSNQSYVLPNLNKCYYEKPTHVIRKTFENDKPNYGECRDSLRLKQNTQEHRDAFVRNITESLQMFFKERQQDRSAFNAYVSLYFDELRKILSPLFQQSISDEDWRVCTKNCLYPLISALPKTAQEKRELLDHSLTGLIDNFLNIGATCTEFVERASSDWLATRTRSQAKYILERGTEIEKHRKTTLELLICRASDYSWKPESATRDEIQYQKWVAKDIVSAAKEDSREFLVQNLAKDNVFNEWGYDTLHEHNLLDVSIIIKGLTLKISELYTTKLLEDLALIYTPAAEDILVQNIKNGRTVNIRAVATKAAGNIFDHKVSSGCPNTILGAVHERFTEQRKDVREEAYASSGKICSDQSIDPLQKTMVKDTKLQGAIKQALDNIFAKFADAKPNEDDAEQTIAWIKVMGKLRDKRAFPLLKPYVDPSTYHRNKTVRMEAIKAIGMLATSEHIQFLENLKDLESHEPELIYEIDRAIGLASNVGDFEFLDIVRKLTDNNSTFSDPKLDLPQLFGDNAKSIKYQCVRAYKFWLGEDYSYYATHLNSVCDAVSKVMMDVFKDKLFGEDDKKYISLRRTDKAISRYNILKSKPGFQLIGSCFGTIHALRVEAPVAHGEDSHTDQPKTDLSPEDGQLAKRNFINAITKSVEMLKKKTFPETGK